MTSPGTLGIYNTPQPKGVLSVPQDNVGKNVAETVFLVCFDKILKTYSCS